MNILFVADVSISSVIGGAEKRAGVRDHRTGVRDRVSGFRVGERTECNNSQLDICMNRIYSIHTLLKFPW